MNLLQPGLFALDATVVVGACVLLINGIRLRGTAVRTVAALVVFYSLIVLPAPILSWLDLLGSQAAHVIAHLTIAGAIYTACWAVHGERPRLSPARVNVMVPTSLVQGARRHPDLAIIAVVLCAVYLTNLLIVLCVRQSTNDALSYHLPRVLYWLQHGNYRPFRTYWLMQTSAPMNSSLAMLWTVLHTGSERLVGLVQYGSVFGSAVVVFGLAGILGFTRTQSAFACLVWLAYPIVVLQAPTAQSDMVAAFLAGSTVYLYIVGVRSRSYGPVFMSALALGGALGTKVTAVLLGLPLAGLVVWSLCSSGRRALRLVSVWVSLCVVCIAVLAGPTYHQNWRHHGNPLGPLAAKTSEYAPAATLRGTASNVARYVFESFDTTGLPQVAESWLQKRLATVGKRSFEVLGVDPNGPPGSISSGCSFGFYEPSPDAPAHWGPRPNRRREETAWMGPIGGPLLLLGVAFGASSWRRRGACGLRPTLSWMAILYALSVSALLPWSPWEGRFMAIGALLATPLIAASVRPTFRWCSVRSFLCVLGAGVASNTRMFSISGPVTGATSVFRSSYAEQRSARQGVEEAQIQAVDSIVPPTASMGAVAVRYEFALFGPDLTRVVTPVFLRPADEPGEMLPSSVPDYIAVGGQYGLTHADLSISGYAQVRSGPWGKLYCHDGLLPAHRARETSLAFASPAAASLPKAVHWGDTVQAHVRLRQPIRLGPWGGEHADAGWFWVGAGRGQGVVMELVASADVRTRVVFDVEPGPSRGEPRRTVELERTASGNAQSQTATCSAGKLSFDLVIPVGDSTLAFACLDDPDVARLPNGDTRSLMLKCRGISLQDVAE